jgi:hypothetical protein
MNVHLRRSAKYGLPVVLAVFLIPAAAIAHPTVYSTSGHLNGGMTNEVWTLTAPTTGTYQPSANAAVIPFDAPSQVVEWALGKDAAIGVNAATRLPNVLVTGAAPSFTLQFQGARGKVDVADAVVSPTAGSAAKVRDGGIAVSYPTSIPADQSYARYVVGSDGYAAVLTEANGLAQNGWLDLAQNPGTYRNSETPAQWLTLGVTGAQTHATCWPVDPATAGGAKLSTLDTTDDNILAVQNWKKEHPADPVQPFWNYVPWQSSGAGFGDTPDQWIATVKAVTGVDLTGMSVATAAAACEAVGGAYVPADTAGSHIEQAFTADQVTAAVAPLTARIDGLTAANQGLTAQVAALTQSLADASAANSRRPLTVAIAGRRMPWTSPAVMVTGAPGARVSVRTVVSKALAKRLRLKSRVVGSVSKPMTAQGAVLVTVKPTKAASKALRAFHGKIHVTYLVRSGSASASATGTLVH